MRVRLHRPGQHGRRHGRQPGQGASMRSRPSICRRPRWTGPTAAGCGAAGSAAEAVEGRRGGDHHAAGRPACAQPSMPNEVLPNAPKSALLIDCSTIDVDSARAVGRQAGAAGFRFADAPVSGGTAAADAGTLAFMVGCDEADFAASRRRCQPMARAIVRAGDDGAGQAAKICNNMVLGVSMLGVCEAFALAEKLGLDAERFFEIASKSSGQCWSHDQLLPRARPGPGRAVQPRLRGRVRRRHDAEGPEAGAGRRRQGRAPRRRWARRPRRSTPCSTGWAMAAKDFSAVIRMLYGRLEDWRRSPGP